MKRVFQARIWAAVLLAGCAPAPVVAPPPPQVPAPACATARDADFEGAGEARLRSFLAWLAQQHGAAVSLAPGQVSLAIVRGPAKPGPGGVTAAEIACGAGGYRIALYRDALVGRPLAVAWETLAHEFHHIVQVRRDGLDCEARKGERERYEAEAAAFGARVVPKCR